MPYGTVKVDNVTFTYNAADATTTFSGFYASTTNNLTLSGTASAATFTGTTASFTNINAQNISVTTALSGLAITGGTAGFTTVTGTTVTGTTANFASGVFTTRISGVTITGTTVSTTTGNFISLTGTTATITSGIIASGTAALPSLAILSDPNTGIYSPGADQLAISTNGTGRLFVDASGNVGVAVTPSAWRTQNKTIQLGATGVFTAGTSATSLLGIGSNWFLDSGSQLKYIASDFATNYEQSGGNHIWYRAASGTAGANLSWSEQMRLTSTGLGIGTSSPSQLLHVSGGNILISNAYYLSARNNANTLSLPLIGRDTSDNVVIDPDGYGTKIGSGPTLVTTSASRVGIGTTSPDAQSQLHIVGSGYQPLFVNTTATGGGGAAFFRSGTQALYVGTGGSSWLSGSSTADGLIRSEANLVFATGGNNQRAQIDSSGRLLVGTSSGSDNNALLKVQGNVGGTTGTGWIDIRRGLTTPGSGGQLGLLSFSDASGNNYASIDAYVDATPGTNDYPGRLVFSTTRDGQSSPTEAMRITNQGAVCINSTPLATERFRVSSSNEWLATFENTRNNNGDRGLYVSLGTNTNNATSYFLECITATVGTKIALYGNGGIANIQANNVNLSDRNAKKDITPAAGTWDCIKEWEIVNYRYKDQPDDAGLSLGVIAQQVAESCPEVITVYQEAKEATEDQPAQEERLGVKEQQMYWMAIKALQEAQLRIETLEAKVASLESA